MTESPDDGVLDAVLGAYPLRARVTNDARYCGRWSEAEPQGGHAWVHLLDRGRCEVVADCLDAPLALDEGDLVMLPHGHPHLLRSAPQAAADSIVRMLCGEFSFIGGSRNPLLDTLPACIVIRGTEAGDGIRRLAQLLIEEIDRPGLGQRALLDKLADALFTMAVRHHLQHAPTQRGLLAGLADPRLRPVLDALHDAPGRDWNLQALAALACLSRTAFAQRFSDTLGIGPIHYLTQWRMNRALELLRDPRLSVASVAERLGYRTEAAFRRSFKRVHGAGPGRFRGRLRQA
jgi:AraC family transcriptional regulator, activator of mtrCDE